MALPSCALIGAALVVSISTAQGALPTFEFVTPRVVNQINTVSNTAASATAPLTSGGSTTEVLVVDGQNRKLVSTFGHPVGAFAFAVSTMNILLADGDSAFATGAEFQVNDAIINQTSVNVAVANWDVNLLGTDGQTHFNEQKLVDAEDYYRRALLINPFTEVALNGIFRSRMARAEKRNLVWDVKRRQQLTQRFGSVLASAGTFAVVDAEIALLQQMSSTSREAVGLLLELYSDPALRGPGDLLVGRNSFAGSNPEIDQDFNRLLFATANRFAQSELALARKRIDRYFFNQGSSSVTNSLDSVLKSLDESGTYVSLVRQMTAPYLNHATYSTLRVEGDSNAVRTNLNFHALAELIDSETAMAIFGAPIRQGYNPLGFVPDFVPFTSGGVRADNQTTFADMKSLADTAVNDLGNIEQGICGNPCDSAAVGSMVSRLRTFAQNQGVYAEKLNQLDTNYGQQLMALVGDVVTTSGGQPEPDVYTFVFPDVDLDGDGVTERDAARARLTSEKQFVFGSNKGQIHEQYQVIAGRILHVDDTLNQMRDLVSRIEDVEAQARVLANLEIGLSVDIYQRLLLDGSKVGILEIERGAVAQAAGDAAANARRRAGMFGAVLTAAVAIVATVYSGGVTAFAALSAVSALTQYQGAIAAGLTGAAPYAIGIIDAQINAIAVQQQADITVATAAVSAESRLIDGAYQARALALQQDNLNLQYAMAQRDVEREMSTLARLMSQAAQLGIDQQRTRALLQNNADLVKVGWAELDIRDAFIDEAQRHDQGLLRAKIWTYVALRALDYYWNRVPAANGQPTATLLGLYQRIYAATTARDLRSVVTDLTTLASTQFLFSNTTVSCPQTAILSFKYHVFGNTVAAYSGTTGSLVGVLGDGGGEFKYISPRDGIQYSGAFAYQAMFRDQLRRAFSIDAGGNRKLDLTFGTTVYPDPPSKFSQFVANPFYQPGARNAKITGFTIPQCSSWGAAQGGQGIIINMTSGQTALAPAISLSQEGNSYLLHTPFQSSDFQNGRLIANPLAKMSVFSAYEQRMPTCLIGATCSGSNPTEEIRIGNKVQSTANAYWNLAPGGTVHLAFTDRALANDQWHIKIESAGGGLNALWLSQLETWLNGPNPTTTNQLANEFLTDIEFRAGWAYQN